MKKAKPTPQRRKIGNILAIPAPDGGYYFGRELKEGVVAFYDIHSKAQLENSIIVNSNVLFRVPVMDRAIKLGRWTTIGNVPLEDDLLVPNNFFIQDPITGKFSIYRQGGAIVPATRDEIDGLECAAGWEPEHVEQRLFDHFAGNKNIWVESLKPKL